MSNSKNRTVGFSSEQELVDEVVKFLVNQGYDVRCEVSNMGQSVDVVASKRRWHMLVEAKISNWRRAIEQCQAHKLVGDHICIALGSMKLSDDLLAAVEEHGLGLIQCKPDSCEWITTPRQVKEYWKPERQKFVEQLKGIAHVR